MKRFFTTIVFLFLAFGTVLHLNAQGNIEKESNEYVKLSMRLLGAVKNDKDVAPYTKEMETLSLDELGEALITDQEIKAFWINTYNAYVQILLTENPELFKERNDFFKKDRVKIGGEQLSFDFIEHGIIRGSKIKLSMGFLKDPFAGELEKKFRVEETDGRIHFALNCGAKSCPYVATFSSVNLDNELDAIAKQFLTRTTTFKPGENTAYVTTLFSWFKGDFSDKGGATGFLKKYNVIGDDLDPEIEYKDYDWTLALNNFTELNIYQ